MLFSDTVRFFGHIQGNKRKKPNQTTKLLSRLFSRTRTIQAPSVKGYPAHDQYSAGRDALAQSALLMAKDHDI